MFIKIILFSIILFLTGCGGSGNEKNEKSNEKIEQPQPQPQPEPQPEPQPQPKPDAKATLSWTAPWSRQDGTSLDLSEIEKYIIKHNFKDEEKEYVVNYPEDTFQINNLKKGIHYFSIKVVDRDGLGSKYSEEVYKEIM